MEKDEEKIVIKLHKEPLESERKEQEQKGKRFVLVLVLAIVLFLGGTFFGYIYATKNVSTSDSSLNIKIKEIEKRFNDSWLYKNDYEDLNSELEDKALHGMTQFIDDPYTTYMSSEELNEFASSINMNYVGIGAKYINVDDTATITCVYKDSPAEKGGLLVGDVIVSVDTKDIKGLTSEEIKELIVGEEGTEVKVKVLRGGKEEELTFVRGAIDTTVYVDTKGDCVILEIMSFGTNTVDECIKYLDQYQDYSKLVIDLRENTGGYQDSLEYIAGLFLGEDKVVLNETDSQGNTVSYKTRVKKYYDNFKDIVVLTNGNTASAAEVLTITLKELHPSCVQVGETTYGKGVVQTTLPLSDGSCVKVTTSYWTSPNGVSINKDGVKPDVEVKLDDILYSTAYGMADDDKYAVDDVSAYVKIAQQSLNYLGYKTRRNDGYFDVSTLTALNEFERNNNLDSKGILDAKTYEALLSRVIYEYNVNPSKDVQLLKALEILGE